MSSEWSLRVLEAAHVHSDKFVKLSNSFQSPSSLLKCSEIDKPLCERIYLLMNIKVTDPSALWYVSYN